MLKAFLFKRNCDAGPKNCLIAIRPKQLGKRLTPPGQAKHVEFADLIYDVSKLPGALGANGQTAPIGLQIGGGVRPIGTTVVFTQGTPEQTGVNTNMAINGEGFFRVLLPDGNFGYTRDGTFVRDSTGQMVNGDGHILDPAVTIAPTAQEIAIAPTGEVSFQENGTSSQAGTIQLYRFANPAGLRQRGGNIYTATDASGPEQAGPPGSQGFGSLRQGHKEGSNVEVVGEMVSLITAQRAYEINSRAIRAGDEMLSNTSQIVR
ncbi:UNVERIFIED_CONTAM: hypothetical protein GTU68_004324 [Idotea baltica]|nr:hypothetical protein [Idotea baltica]